MEPAARGVWEFWAGIRHTPHLSGHLSRGILRVSNAADDVIDFLAIEPLMQVPGVATRKLRRVRRI
jgi:hypothetical protein